MKILTECALCRMGVLSRAPLCFGSRNPLGCMCWRILSLKCSNKEHFL